MNDRIRQFAEHAELPNPHVPGQWRFNNQQLEFFAELIIRECVESFKKDECVLNHFGILHHNEKGVKK
jgi:hypothetical protein